MRLSHFTHRYGTPLMAGLFAVSLVSGVALFFHWAPGTFHRMHEWLSLLLLAPFIVHLWKNWKPLTAYARRKTLIVPLVLSIIVAVPFAVTAGKGRAGSPAFQTITLMTHASVADLAPVFREPPEVLLHRLQRRGYRAGSIDDRLSTIASASAAPATDVLYALMPGEVSGPGNRAGR